MSLPVYVMPKLFAKAVAEVMLMYHHMKMDPDGGAFLSSLHVRQARAAPAAFPVRLAGTGCGK